MNNDVYIKDNLYCLNDIVNNLIGSKNPKDYLFRVKEKQSIDGNFYISKDRMIEILSKSKAAKAKEYLAYLQVEPKNNEIIVKDKTIHTTTKEEHKEKVDNRKFVDFGKNQLIYSNNQIIFFNYQDKVYFKAKDVCEMLGFTNSNKAINDHVDIEDKISWGNWVGGNESLPPTHNITHINQFKLSIEKKINKIIDPQTVFINESGLYSLIMSSKLPAAKQFRRWVTSEVLPSIRKTGTYEIPNAPNYSNEKLKELGNTSCVYIIHVKDNLYKFGMTANSYNRMQSHKNNLNYNEIIKIFEIPNSDISKTIEDRIKKYTNNAKIRKILDEGVEFFETNEEYNIESVLKDINIMVETEVEIYEKKSNNSKLDALSFIEIQKIKQYELMCKSDEIKLKQLEIEANMRIEIEREKTKQLQLQLDLAILNQKQPLKGIVINNQLEDKPKIEIIKKDPIEKKIIARIDTRSKSKKCNDCDTMIYHTSSRCDPCEKVRRKENNQKNTNHPSKENLLKDLNELKYYTLVGQKYNVSDNTIRKWLKK